MLTEVAERVIHTCIASSWHGDEDECRMHLLTLCSCVAGLRYLVCVCVSVCLLPP